MNTIQYDDIIAKAVQVLQRKGALEVNELGAYRSFQDLTIDIQAFRLNGLDLVIGNTSGGTALEIWNGRMIIHAGDHLELYAHLNKIFYLTD